MSDFKDLVICKDISGNKLSIYVAPAWAGLQKGDRVLVESAKSGESEAMVEKSYTVDVSNKDAFEFILIAGGVSLPLKKVLKKVVSIYLDYEDENAEKGLDPKT